VYRISTGNVLPGIVNIGYEIIKSLVTSLIPAVVFVVVPVVEKLAIMAVVKKQQWLY